MIYAPHHTEEVALGFQGPVEVEWSEEGEMKLEVAGPGYGFVLAPITVTAEEQRSIQQYWIDPLLTSGTYTITAGRADGSETSSISITLPPLNVAAVLSPVDGAAVAYGWRGPLRIRWDSIKHPGAFYVVGVDGAPACVYGGAALSPGAVTSCTLDWTPPLGEHSITVEEVGVETFVLTSFTVEPNLALVGLSAAPYRFYPYVRDSYRDRTLLHFDLNKGASVVIKVRNAAGRTVRRAALGHLESGGWTWNGRTDAGYLVPTGPYKIVLEARALGELRRGVREVVVARGWVTKHATKERCGGCGPGAYAHSQRCYVDFDVWRDGDAFLDCWGGEFAIVAWRFRVPANAFDVTKRVIGEVMCCSPGDVAAVGERRGPRTYVVAAGVSGWRSWDVRRVRVTYSYRVRI